MSEKRTTPGVTSTEGSEQETAALAGETISDVYFSTSSGPISSILGTSHTQPKIAQFLFTGRRNAVPLRELVRITKKDARTVRLLIQQDRANGFPICSDNESGYFMPIDEGERARCVQSMRHRAREIQQTACNIERGQVL